MTIRRAKIKQIFDPVLAVERSALRARKLVYLLVANKPIRYGKKYSRIVYVGTTEHGVRRIASSAANRAGKALGLPGVTRVEAFVLHCKLRKHVKMWEILERAVLLAFRDEFNDQVPRLNIQGRGIRVKNEFKIFSRPQLRRIVNRYP